MRKLLLAAGLGCIAVLAARKVSVRCRAACARCGCARGRCSCGRAPDAAPPDAAGS